MSHDQATVAEEEYLQSMYWLMEAGLPITGANIARAMQLSPPTVHEMIGRLERDGYVTRADDKSLAFTEEGRQHAEQISRRHRMIERFLTDVLGIPWDEVHEEAERLEHAMSPVLEERMLAAIGDAKTCPHGHPIVEGAREQGALLADVEVGAKVVVLRFENEAEELLHYLKDAGLDPGLEGTVERSDEDSVVIVSEGGAHQVSRSVAETVSVRADPSPPAALGPARAAGPLQRSLRALSGAAQRAGFAAFAFAILELVTQDNPKSFQTPGGERWATAQPRSRARRSCRWTFASGASRSGGSPPWRPRSATTSTSSASAPTRCATPTSASTGGCGRSPGAPFEPLPQVRVAARGATREPEDAALRPQVPGMPALAVAAGLRAAAGPAPSAPGALSYRRSSARRRSGAGGGRGSRPGS